MTAVSASSSTASSSGYARTLLDRNGGKSGGSTATAATTASSGDQVTLSAAARAILAARDAAGGDESRAAMLARTKTDLAALKTEAGDAAPDLSALDRRQLYAVAANLDGSFDADAVAAAKAEMKLRLGDALRGPEAAARVTGKLGGLYTAADAFLDAAGPEEKASNAWKARKAAVATAEGDFIQPHGVGQRARDASAIASQ